MAYNFRSRRARNQRRRRRRAATRRRHGVSQRRDSIQSRRKRAISNLRARRTKQGGVVSRYSGTPSFQKKYTKTLTKDIGEVDRFGETDTQVITKSMDLSNLQDSGGMLAPQFGTQQESKYDKPQSFIDKVVSKLRQVGKAEAGKEQTYGEKFTQFITPQSKGDLAIEALATFFPPLKAFKGAKWTDDATKAAAKWDLEKILKTGNSKQKTAVLSKMESQITEAAAKRFGTKKGLGELLKKEAAVIAKKNADELKRLETNIVDIEKSIAKTRADNAAAAAMGKLDDIDPNRVPFLEGLLEAAKKTVPSAFNRLRGKSIKTVSKSAHWLISGNEWQTKLIMDKSGRTMGKKTINSLRKFLINKRMGYIGVGAYVALLGFELVAKQQYKETFNDYSFTKKDIDGVEDPEFRTELMKQWRMGKTELELFAARHPEMNKFSWLPNPINIAKMYTAKGKAGFTRVDIIDKIFADEIEKYETGITDEALMARNESDMEQWTMENSIEKIRLEAIEFDRQQAVIRARQRGQNRAEIEQAELIHRLAMERLALQKRMDEEMQAFWTAYLKKKEEMMQNQSSSNLNFGGLF